MRAFHSTVVVQIVIEDTQSCFKAEVHYILNTVGLQRLWVHSAYYYY